MSGKPGRCCSTERTWFGAMQVQWRGQPKIKKAGRKVFHVEPNHHFPDQEGEVFWHWYDQRLFLAEGYGP